MAGTLPLTIQRCSLHAPNIVCMRPDFHGHGFSRGAVLLLFLRCTSDTHGTLRRSVLGSSRLSISTVVRHTTYYALAVRKCLCWDPSDLRTPEFFQLPPTAACLPAAQRSRYSNIVRRSRRCSAVKVVYKKEIKQKSAQRHKKNEDPLYVD